MHRRICTVVGKKLYILLCLLTIIVLSACGSQQSHKVFQPQILSNKVNADKIQTATPQIVIPRQVVNVTPSPTPKATVGATATATQPPTPVATAAMAPPPQATPPTNIPGGGLGNSPYGSPPAITGAEVQLTQQLFGLINSDRAVRGLYPFTWNATLSAGARQHAWDMVHCGFSHTCPSGLNQCTRIANEGFAGFTDCGENIGLAGPYPTAWGGVYNVQESMINEPPSGWHRIHLTSVTLHRMGVGLFVDAKGWIWFVEDAVS